MTSTPINYIPTPSVNYVPFGVFPKVRRFIQTSGFRTLMIVGETGNGKTQAVEQACALEKQPLLRVNLTVDSDERLLGFFELRDGATVWMDGPVTIAAKQGAVLLLDEEDYGGSKAAVLQAVLEGKPFLLPNGERVVPHPKFKIIATANTFGRGSDNGRYVGNQVQNEAKLDRFHVCLVQHYPTPTEEFRILKGAVPADVTLSEDILRQLCAWAAFIRETYERGGCEDVMTTRRLLNLVRSLSVFEGDVLQTIEAAVARFGPVTAKTFVDYYHRFTPQPAAPAAQTLNDVVADLPDTTL